MARKHTASFILELPMKTDPADERACTIILDAGRNIGNAVLGEGTTATCWHGLPRLVGAPHRGAEMDGQFGRPKPQPMVNRVEIGFLHGTGSPS
jgi:hypothetical protein